MKRAYDLFGGDRMVRWKDTEYFITEDGKVWSEKSQRFLKPQKHKRGYLAVTLRYDGHSHVELIHRMVAKTFVPNPNNLPMVNHKDGNKHNPKASNLEWVTPSENVRHAIENGLLRVTPSYGSANGNAKKVEAYTDNESLVFDTVTEASKALGINRSAISRCLIGKSKSSGGYKWRYYTKL
jgi:hypothetical protein